MNRKRGMEDLNIVICGAAGQGIKTVEKLLSRMFGITGHFVFSTKEYMSRVRGAAIQPTSGYPAALSGARLNGWTC